MMKSGTGIQIIPKKTTSSYLVTGGDFNITTTVTNDPDEVISHLNCMITNYLGVVELIIGLEVQCCRQSSTSKPAILTLCDEDSCLIIQLSCLGEISNQLKNLFSDKRCKFVGANVGHSVAMLEEEYRISVARYEDISDDIARGRRLEEFLDRTTVPMLSKLMMDLMIMRKTPEVEVAVWEKQKLDEDLVAYATLESYISYTIGEGHKDFQSSSIG